MRKVCAFFGHRDIPAGLEIALYEQVRRAVTECGVTTFWVGGYGRFDALAAQTVKRLKQEFPNIELLLILPYLPAVGQRIPALYDGSVYPEGLELVPKRYAISKRNIWMAKNCDMVICYIRNSFGGAYEAVKAASEKEIINLSAFP